MKNRRGWPWQSLLIQKYWEAAIGQGQWPRGSLEELVKSVQPVHTQRPWFALLDISVCEPEPWSQLVSVHSYRVSSLDA